jgi:hypothetical protein
MVRLTFLTTILSLLLAQSVLGQSYTLRGIEREWKSASKAYSQRAKLVAIKANQSDGSIVVTLTKPDEKRIDVDAVKLCTEDRDYIKVQVARLKDQANQKNRTRLNARTPPKTTAPTKTPKKPPAVVSTQKLTPAEYVKKLNSGTTKWSTAFFDFALAIDDKWLIAAVRPEIERLGEADRKIIYRSMYDDWKKASPAINPELHVYDMARNEVCVVKLTVFSGVKVTIK